MKILIIIFLSLSISNSFCQTQKEEKLAEIVPLYDFYEDDSSYVNDTNAYKIGYIPWVFKGYTDKGSDTTWMKENLFDGDDAERWVFIARTENKSRWYIYKKYVAKQSGITTVWIRIKVPSKDFDNKKYKNAEELFLCAINTKLGTFKIIRNSLKDSTGKVISENRSYEDYGYPDPESIMEFTIKTVPVLFP